MLIICPYILRTRGYSSHSLGRASVPGHRVRRRLGRSWSPPGVLQKAYSRVTGDNVMTSSGVPQKSWKKMGRGLSEGEEREDEDSRALRSRLEKRIPRLRVGRTEES
ncbi:hypothetical protein NDU88_004213 [Pleurodeles waltl]|uniref:Uncharacterized protein n=1 Tax=Pleurodeles waltl TaxID=8319 RepID=A0AAV7VFJ7_PLEWA|nr:hypothetical protein NDU88_004213 [Pleurodeles waltl]